MTDDEIDSLVKSEIQAAVKILRDDGHHIHKTYSQFMASQKSPEPPEDTQGKPPPVKDKPRADPPAVPPANPPVTRKSLWFGERAGNE